MEPRHVVVADEAMKLSERADEAQAIVQSLRQFKSSRVVSKDMPVDFEKQWDFPINLEVTRLWFENSLEFGRISQASK